MKKLTQLGAAVVSSIFAFNVALAGQQAEVTTIISGKSEAVASSGFSCAARIQGKQAKLNKFVEENKVVIAPLAVLAIYKGVVHSKKTRYEASLRYLESLAAGERDASITNLMNNHVRPAFALTTFQVSSFNQGVDGNKALCKKLYRSTGSLKRSDAKKDHILARAYRKVKS